MLEGWIDLSVRAVIVELWDENPDIPASWWKTLVAELSDSRLYYKGVYCDPTYEEALLYAEAAVKDYRSREQPSAP